MRRPASCLACFENGRDPARDHRPAECQAYERQRAFNARMRRLLADETPWYERPVPAGPDFSEPWIPGSGLRGGGRSQRAREIYELLAQDGRTYRQFVKACERARVVLASLPTETTEQPAKTRARKAA